MLLVITGNSGVGKDTWVDDLVCYHNFKKIVSYTTRSRRAGEQNYHFISHDDLQSYQKLAPAVINNEWYFLNQNDVRTALNSDQKYVVILTVDGLNTIYDYAMQLGKSNQVYSAGLYWLPSLRKLGMEERGDAKADVIKRVQFDQHEYELATKQKNSYDIFMTKTKLYATKDEFLAILNTKLDALLQKKLFKRTIKYGLE